MRALIFYGGWQEHAPAEGAQLFAEMLQPHGFELKLANTLDVLMTEDLHSYDLIIPNWTMGVIEDVQLQLMLQAVKEGVGLGGLHGGMGDAFRTATEYQFMVGG